MHTFIGKVTRDPGLYVKDGNYGLKFEVVAQQKCWVYVFGSLMGLVYDQVREGMEVKVTGVVDVCIDYGEDWQPYAALEILAVDISII
jgi:hypothetical protein